MLEASEWCKDIPALPPDPPLAEKRGMNEIFGVWRVTECLKLWFSSSKNVQSFRSQQSSQRVVRRRVVKNKRMQDFKASKLSVLSALQKKVD